MWSLTKSALNLSCSAFLDVQVGLAPVVKRYDFIAGDNRRPRLGNYGTGVLAPLGQTSFLTRSLVARSSNVGGVIPYTRCTRVHFGLMAV